MGAQSSDDSKGCKAALRKLEPNPFCVMYLDGVGYSGEDDRVIKTNCAFVGLSAYFILRMLV